MRLKFRKPFLDKPFRYSAGPENASVGPRSYPTYGRITLLLQYQPRTYPNVNRSPAVPTRRSSHYRADRLGRHVHVHLLPDHRCPARGAARFRAYGSRLRIGDGGRGDQRPVLRNARLAAAGRAYGGYHRAEADRWLRVAYAAVERRDLWSGFDNCQDFVWQAIIERKHSPTRDALVGVAIFGGVVALAAGR